MFICSAVDGHLTCFHFVAVMNIDVEDFGQYFHFAWVCIYIVKLLGDIVTLTFEKLAILKVYLIER